MIRSLEPDRSSRSAWQGLAWLALPLLLVVLMLGAACGGDDDQASTSGTSGAGETTLTIKVSDVLRFEPSELTVTAGKPVVLQVENTGSMVHDFSIEQIGISDTDMMGESHDMEHMPTGAAMDMDMHMAVDPGQMAELHFTPTQAGEFTFFCSVAGHQEAGMHGTLNVSGA
jgi:uncharacterized cupredoxin-like copper-binding protein